jgi:hypothetical protein
MTPAVFRLLDLIDVLLQQCDALVCRNFTVISIYIHIYHIMDKSYNPIVFFSPQMRVGREIKAGRSGSKLGETPRQGDLRIGGM